MGKTDDMNEDEQVPTTEPIAPQEPSEAVVVEFPLDADGLHTGGMMTAREERRLRHYEDDPETALDPFAGFLQDNAAIRVGTWAGFPNYECSACQYASLDESKTQAHISIHGQTFTQGARP